MVARGVFSDNSGRIDRGVRSIRNAYATDGAIGAFRKPSGDAGVMKNVFTRKGTNNTFLKKGVKADNAGDVRRTFVWAAEEKIVWNGEF